MKNSFLLLYLFLAFFHVKGQISQEIQLSGGVINSFSPYYRAGSADISGGFSYQLGWEKYKAALSIGLNYLPINLKKTKFECPFEPWFCDFPKAYLNKFQLIEVPILLKKQIFLSKSQKWNMEILGGYSIGKILGMHAVTIFRTGEKNAGTFSLTGLIPIVHFFNAGLTANYPINPKITLSLSSIYKLTNIYDERYSYISSFYTNIGIARKFGK
jgi:hypothetical protein